MAPKISEDLKCDKSCCKDEQTTFVFLINDVEGSEHLEMVRLKHPGTGKPAFFVFTKGNENVYELLTFSDNYRSYFIGNTVKSNGNVYITTPIDPLFLILPYLFSSSHCSPLDQILIDDDYPDIERLIDNATLVKNITKIAEKKGVNIFGYKYDETKTLDWLEKKVSRTVDALRKNSVTVSNSTTVSSNNFQKHSIETADTQENYLRCAFGIVSEYLMNEVKQKLQCRLGITNETEQSSVKRNRSASRDSKSETKKTKIKDDENSENSPPKQKVEIKTTSAKEKARAKAAVGSKSISSFFKKSTK